MRDRPSLRSAAVFFTAAFGVTWALQLPALLAHLGVIAGPFERFLPLTGCGAFGPSIAAAIALRTEPVEDRRPIFRPVVFRRVSVIWYPIALLLSGAILTAGLALLSLVRGRVAGPWFLPPTDAPRIAAMVVFSVGEEIGWRGFALPRLQARLGALPASLVLGALWGAWHLPMLIIAGITAPATFALLVPFFLAGSVVFTWVYNRTGQSLLFAILFHMGVHLDNSHRALPGNVTPVIAHTLGYCLMAAAVVLLDRKLWSATRAFPVG